MKAKLLKWGNSFGLRLSRQDVARLKLRPGAEVEVKVEVAPDGIDVAEVRSFHLGGDAADEHDTLFEASVAGDVDTENA